ncbi:MAG: methyltransferase domain-containing protein [Cyclobacteriaceae bacterium]|nr:methyltransferase domain-containing protein [Cyclobacteriaceae bacterium]
MKLRNPSSRFKLNIPNGAKVLDVGSGHNPHPRANVITDKFVSDNFHRSDNIRVIKNQKFIEADGERLPFEDKEFDYVICCHVIEHVENPEKFVNELCRVGKSGYLEAPSLIGEFLVPKQSHKWVLLEIDEKIVIMDKEKIGLKNSHDFGFLFLDHLPGHSLGFKILQRTQPQVLNVAYEWRDSIEILVNPSDQKYIDYFTKPWSPDMYESVIPHRGLLREVVSATSATFDIAKSVFRSRVLQRSK